MSPPAMDNRAQSICQTACRRLVCSLARLARPLVLVFVVAACCGAAALADDVFVDHVVDPAIHAELGFQLVIDHVPVGGTIVVENASVQFPDLKPGLYEIRINESLLGAAVFGRNAAAPLVRQQLDTALRRKVEIAGCICALTAAQRQKLELAGRGDIVHFLWRFDEMLHQAKPLCVGEDQPPLEALMEWSRKLAREILPLQRTFAAGVLGDGSLFARVQARMLTAEQLARYDTVREIERAGGKFIVRLRQAGAGAANEIQLSATKIDDAGLSSLKQVTGLHSLLLDGTRITDAGLANLSGLTDLEVLDLRNTAITDAGLKSLPVLTNLRTLRLDGTKITDAGLVHLKTLQKLEYLHLGSTDISGVRFADLQGLTSLRDLYLGDTRVTDDALAQLRGLTDLEHLSLSDTRVTNAGLTSLNGMTHLKRLFLIGTEVTPDGASELRRSLPKLTIIR